MADRDLRSIERDAARGDPDARARLLRQLCRERGHTWVHYKGGDHHCKVCKRVSRGDVRELGAQTYYGFA